MSRLIKSHFLLLLYSFLLLAPGVSFAEEEVVEHQDKWSREISLGYNRSSGNTEKAELWMRPDV